MSPAEQPEQAALQANWLVRAYYTPVSDALRGDLSGRLERRSEITSAGLPMPLAELILQVVRKARLWREERLDVSRELVAHFSDGLAAGQSPEQLVADFGDPASAARLIRKAKLRARPYWWQAWWGAMRLCLAALTVGVVGYMVLSARFYLGSGRLTHNYMAEVNAQRVAPREDAAWPLYRDAAAQVCHVPDFEKDRDAAERSLDDWDALAAYIAVNGETIERIRQGARKSHFGAPLENLSGEANPELLFAGLDCVQVTRDLARLLLLDVRVAAHAGEPERVVEDLTTTLSMAEQLCQPGVTLVEQLVAFAIMNQALETVGLILEHHPGMFSDEQLLALAHHIAANRVGDWTPDFAYERLNFDDVLQRVFTDDGQGDGRVTPEGLEWLARNGNISRGFLGQAANDGSTAAMVLVGPGMASMIGSRRENRDRYNSLIDEMIRMHQDLPWEWDHRAMQATVDRVVVARDFARHIAVRSRQFVVPRASRRLHRRRVDHATARRYGGGPCPGDMAQAARGVAGNAWPACARSVAGRAARSDGWPTAALSGARRQAASLLDRRRPGRRPGEARNTR